MRGWFLLAELSSTNLIMCQKLQERGGAKIYLNFECHEIFFCFLSAFQHGFDRYIFFYSLLLSLMLNINGITSAIIEAYSSHSFIYYLWSHITLSVYTLWRMFLPHEIHYALIWKRFMLMRITMCYHIFCAYYSLSTLAIWCMFKYFLAHFYSGYWMS